MSYTCYGLPEEALRRLHVLGPQYLSGDHSGQIHREPAPSAAPTYPTADGIAPRPVNVRVDFPQLGCATRFTTRLHASVRALLSAGQKITVSSDDVAQAPARVINVSADDPVVELELLGPVNERRRW